MIDSNLYKVELNMLLCIQILSVEIHETASRIGRTISIYLLKEEFRTIFENIQSKDKAARFLDAWILKAERTGDKYLSKFITTLKNWRDQILNYFIERITNGFVEGLNNGLRTIMRTAFGYRNFINFRLRAAAQFGAVHVNPR